MTYKSASTIASFEIKLGPSVNGIWILEMMGRVGRENLLLASMANSSPIVERLTKAQAQTLVIDLSAAEQFGSMGVQFLLVLHKQLTPHDIQIVLRQPNAHLQRVLQIMQFDQVFKFEVEDNRL